MNSPKSNFRFTEFSDVRHQEYAPGSRMVHTEDRGGFSEVQINEGPDRLPGPWAPAH